VIPQLYKFPQKRDKQATIHPENDPSVFLASTSLISPPSEQRCYSARDLTLDQLLLISETDHSTSYPAEGTASTRMLNMF